MPAGVTPLVLDALQPINCTHPTMPNLWPYTNPPMVPAWAMAQDGKKVKLVSCDPCNHNGKPWYGIGCANGRVTYIDSMEITRALFLGGMLWHGNNLNGTLPKLRF
ncbi:MAG: hypothetical protein IPO26_20015 [Saprospiraceae bacterium]|nr:hypothetical protein [Saprospiraceae bacterium]